LSFYIPGGGEAVLSGELKQLNGGEKEGPSEGCFHPCPAEGLLFEAERVVGNHRRSSNWLRHS